MNILGIESSCDETAAAVVADGGRIRSNVVSSQIDIHRPYGGVVPELASRNHLKLIIPVVVDALNQAGISAAALDAVAATYGPGLSSSLLIGLNAAKGLAFALGKPFIPVNHMEAHLYSPFIGLPAEPEWPVVALIVSGGHTILVRIDSWRDYRILGQTLDDAAGEAFDKVAKLLRLGYPGGPEIDRLARPGRANAIAFPRSLLHSAAYDFSFSGLKTAVLYYLRAHPTANTADVCASFQEAVVEVLVSHLLRAADEFGARTVSASGGVSLNSRFRDRLAQATAARGWQLLLAPPELCADNAAMIAARSFYRRDPVRPADWSADIAPSCGLEHAA